MVPWFSLWTHNTGVVSSNPACVTIETSLARKTKGNHIVKSTSREMIHSPVPGFCYARNRVCDADQLNYFKFSFMIELSLFSLFLLCGLQLVMT